MELIPMGRRAFLTLIASAPIAALAPLPKLLPAPAHQFTPNPKTTVTGYVHGLREWTRPDAGTSETRT